MNAKLLFYLARQTAYCQRMAEKTFGECGFTVTSALACTTPDNLRRALASALRDNRMVAVIGEVAPDGTPVCTPAICAVLNIPLDEDGAPVHVLRLSGSETRGYWIESLDRAVLLLPDVPDELEQLLRLVLRRLTGKEPDETVPDFDSMDAGLEKAARIIAGKHT